MDLASSLTPYLCLPTGAFLEVSTHSSPERQTRDDAVEEPAAVGGHEQLLSNAAGPKEYPHSPPLPSIEAVDYTRSLDDLTP